MKFLILVMCLIFTKYCCLGVDIDATDTDKKKQDLSEEAVDAAKTFNNLLMPGPRIFYETSTQTASSTVEILENKKQDQEQISNGLGGPKLTDQNPTQTASSAGIIEEKTKEEEGKISDDLSNSPSSIDRGEKDESDSQNKSVATGTDSMLDETKNTNINEGGKGAANSAVILDDGLQSTTKDETEEKPVIPTDLEKNQNSGSAGPLVTNTQKNTPTGNSAVGISTGFETNEKKTEDVEKDEEKKDEELVELVRSTYTPSKVKDGDGNRITADGAGVVSDGSGIISDNQDRKNDEKEDEIIPHISGNVFGNNQPDSKVTDGGTQSKAIDGNDKVVNTGNSVGKIAESSTKYTGLNAEKGIEVEKETGSKDALLDKSEGKTVLETSDDNSKIENKNIDNQDSVGSVGAITTEISNEEEEKISNEEEENKVNNKIDSESQDSYYSTTTGTSTGFSDDEMDSEDVNISTSPAETITESPVDDKDDFDDDEWWEDFEESNDDDNGNDNSYNDISGDYYDDQDGEIEDLDDIAEEDDDYDYDDDDYDYDDEEGDEDGNNDEGDNKNYSSDNEVPPKDALITGGDFENADTWNENENDGPSKNLESDEKYGLDADDDETDEPIKNVETDDNYGSDSKNDENPESDNDEDDGGYVQDDDKIQQNDDENHDDIDSAPTTYPTVTEDYYYGDDDDDDEDDDYYDEDDEDDEDMKDTVESGLEDGYITEGKRPDQKFLEDDRRYKEMTVEFEKASSYSWILFLTIIVITLMFVLYINKSKLQRYFTRSAPKAVRIGDEEKNLLEYEYA